MAVPTAVTGPFYPRPVRTNSIQMLAEKGRKTSRLTGCQKLKMAAKAFDLGVHISFEVKEIDGWLCVAELSDQLKPGRLPKKRQQRPFVDRANCVMSIAGTAYDAPDTAALLVA